ncbi:MAG: peptidyl-prolyl cis-trans isomerase [Holophagales bacterium]|nr:peptidyl-prolyl cis-trans isomerase [Holophagales bacterium]
MNRLLREPLAHFLAIGAALFLFFAWKGGAGASSGRIVVTRARLESLAAGFARTWQRPPTAGELKGLVDGYVREEIAVREAMATGLDRDDTIIRRRLKQKVDFLAEDRIDSAPPTDADLAAWLSAHPDLYRAEERVSFRQVCLTPEKRGGPAAAEAEAKRLATALEKKGPGAEAEGDSLLLPPDMPLAPKGEIARVFGSEFADAVVRIEPGHWTAPVPSGFGIHAVLVLEKAPARSPALADVRTAVERDFTADRRTKELEALYARLLAKTKVVIETAPEKK